MSKLEDFLTPLHQGVWEVIVLKEDVTEPLGKGWVKSGFNLPSPGRSPPIERAIITVMRRERIIGCTWTYMTQLRILPCTSLMMHP